MFLKYKNIIFKIRRSKVTDYAALREKMHKFFNFMYKKKYNFNNSILINYTKALKCCIVNIS